MKAIIVSFALVFCFNSLQAQKEPGIRKGDTKVVNQKLVQLQSTVKKLEATLTEAKTLMTKLQEQKDAISELNKEDMLWLQRLTEKKSQLEQLISNVKSAASEVKSNIANNLRSS